jgi:hypothetical protein
MTRGRPRILVALNWYTRPYRPGEFGPLPDAGIVRVLVEQLEPGFPIRLPLTLLDTEPRGRREEGGVA